MLSETDVHYLVGYLYVASRERLVSVTLGEKLYDEAAAELRDVDIAILAAGEIGVIAVEVKDHTRKLDVIAVEQLCQKLADMPAVARRAIVSSSGFYEPARRKATGHDVACLHFVRGSLPKLSTVDITNLSEITVRNTAWHDGPHVTVAPTVPLSAADRQHITPLAVITLSNGEVVTLKELCDRLAQQFDMSQVDLLVGASLQVDVTAPFDHPVQLLLGDRVIEAVDARIRGTIQRTETVIPIHTACYLADESGSPFASAAVFEVGGTLFGLGVGAGSDTLRLFQIPADIRTRRPLRHRIFGNTA